ncbi:MAG TPA: ABC transporter permease [Vicinamibacterales bacterium]|nr:ABC transporter permease [Vicinamibacterales bacterium]
MNAIQDLRHSLRQLRRKPAFTASAVLTLAIGMGVNAVAFSVVNGFLFKGYALSGIPDTGRILTTPGGEESGYASLEEYQRFADATNGVLDIAAEGRSSVAWKHANSTDTAWVLYVSQQYFSLITPPLAAGRLSVERDGADTSVVIGERFWREKLGSPSLAGLSLRLNNSDVTVAGVIADSWTGPAGIYSPDVWLPLEDLSLFGASPATRQRDARWLFVMGRLRDGATPAQAHGLVQAAAAQMARDWPDTHADRGAGFRMFEGGNSEVRAVAYSSLLGMGVIGLVLLLACFNVANLLLARAVERERDMGIRAALGAKPGRLMQLVVAEGFVIAALSGALALLLAWWTQSLVTSFAIPIEQPQHIDMTPDFRVVLFIGALIVLAGVLPGLWPAISAARIDVMRVLGSQGANAVGARPSRMRGWLVGAQVAGSTMFLAVAGLFLQSYSTLTTFDVGFARNHLVVADFDPGVHGYDASASERFASAFRDRVRAVPGIVDVAIADRAPFFIGYERTTKLWPQGVTCEAGNCRNYPTYAVSAGYFKTMGIGIAEGREFSDGSTAGQVIINGTLANTLWPNGGALGRTVRAGETGEPLTVIGVTTPNRIRGLDREPAALFVPLDESHYQRSLTLVARTAGPPVSMVRPVHDAAQATDANVSMAAVKTMEQRMGVALWPFRTLTWLFSICGGLALVLATVGLAGVVIHAVNRRVREFGVRLSIGATPRDLMRDVLASSIRMLIPGVIIGLVLAAAAAQLARFMFIGVNVLNPATYVVVALVQTGIVVIACIAPALRASRVDPLTALRAE